MREDVDPSTDARQQSGLLSLAGWGDSKTRLKGITLVAVTGLVFYLLFRKIEIAAVGAALTAVPISTLLGAGALVGLLPIIASLRWKLMLKSLGHSVPWNRCLPVLLGIYPVNVISPSKAGDLLRVLGLRGQVPATTIMGSLLVERSIDLIVLSLMSVAGGILLNRPEVVVPAAVVLIIVVGILAASLFVHRLHVRLWLGAKLNQLSEATGKLLFRPGTLFGVVILTTGNWLIAVAVVALLFQGVGADVSFVDILAALPIAIFVGILPITFGGMGTREAAMVFVFSGLASAPQSLVVGLLYTVFVYWLLGLVGLPFLRRVMAL